MTGEIKFELQGIEEIQNGFKQLSADTIKSAAAAVRTEAELVLAASKKEVPKGLPYPNLVNTGQTRVRVNPDGTVSGIVEYLAEYAIYVHNINKNYRVGKWQYLADPLRKLSASYVDRLASKLRSDVYG